MARLANTTLSIYNCKETSPIVMSTFLTLALIIGLPIAASNGALYRGAWAGIAVISFVLGLGLGMTPVPPDDTPGSAITTADVKQWLFIGLMFIFLDL
jgi:hypothetical protein